MTSKDVVLIIEDSVAIGILLKEFLTKLEYSDIKIAETGESGVTAFRELVENNTPPLVFLDYNLPDSTAKSVMSQILTVKPDTKIIIETANSKDEDIIKEVIGLGAYHYIQKPLHFNAIQEIIKILEEEQAFLQKKPDHEEILEESKEKIIEHIDFILKSAQQISLNKITSILGFSNDSVLEYLKQLKDDGKVIQLDDKKEIACNQCNSVRNSQIFYCPNCKDTNFKLGKLIEHYDCGNVSEENTYHDDECPKCKKKIKALGVDYKVLQNHYICNNCNDFFPEISTDYICLKCENRFKLEDAKWVSSVNYKVK